MAIRLTINCRVIILFTVYFPCLSSRPKASYKTDLSQCLGFIDSVISVNSGSDIVIMGKMNFTYCNDNPGLSMFNNFLHNCICKDISFCDNLLGQYSYVSESLGNMSLIEHVFM